MHLHLHTQTDGQMHNDIHTVAPNALYNPAKLELCATAYLELGLDS